MLNSLIFSEKYIKPNFSQGEKGMGQLFDRVGRVVRASLNDAAISQNPKKAVEDALKEMQQGLEDLGLSITHATDYQKRIEFQIQQAQHDADNWQNRARLSLQKGDERLAREALLRKNQCLVTVSSLKTQLEQQTSRIDSLQSQQTEWRVRLMNAQSKKDSLIEKAVRAQANPLLQSSSMAAFERWEKKALEMEARSQAAAELAGADLETQFAMLESGTNVDDDLKAMKEYLLGGTSCCQPQPSDTDAQLPDGICHVTFDDELEALKTKLDQL